MKPIGGKFMEIKIGVGLDNLVFGMSQEEVKNILGIPDKVTDTEKENGIVYYFNNKLIKTKFDKDENLRLYSIEVYNPEAVLFNQKILNKTKNEIINLIQDAGYNKIEYEDYDTFDTIFCEEIWSTFTFEFDRLRNIEFSPLFKDGNKIIWPIRV